MPNLGQRLESVRRVPTEIDHPDIVLTVATTNLPLIAARTNFLWCLLNITGMRFSEVGGAHMVQFKVEPRVLDGQALTGFKYTHFAAKDNQWGETLVRAWVPHADPLLCPMVWCVVSVGREGGMRVRQSLLTPPNRP